MAPLTRINSEKEPGIWELYGLKANPFSTNPLLIRGGILPIDCFIGRKEELDKLHKQFKSKGGSRTLITGDVGVGKTTLVNFARYSILKTGGFFTPIQELGVQENWSANEFIINTLYAIYSTLQLESAEKMLSKKTFEMLESVVGVNIESSTGFGINFMGAGGNLSRMRGTTFAPSFTALKEIFSKIVEEIHNNAEKELIIHYNNLERVGESKLRGLFEDLRDFLQIPNVHFIFVGNLVVGGTIYSLPRVISIFQESIILKELTVTEIKEILDKRFEKLKIGGLNTERPYDDSVIKMLYELYRGNIRNILNSLNMAVLDSPVQPYKLSANEAAEILKRHAEHMLERPEQQPRAIEVLKKIVEAGEITNKGLADATHTSGPNISLYIKDLRGAGLVYLKKKNGKDKYWSADPRLKWLLLKADNRDLALSKFIK